MGAIWLIARADLRRRRRELLLLAVLVALTTGAAMAATVAAVRADTSVERFLRWSQQSSASFPVGEDPERLIGALRQMPEVEALAVGSTLSVFIVEDPDEPLSGPTFEIEAPVPVDDRLSVGTAGVDIDRPLLVAGRMPDQDQAGEILLLEWMADQTGWGIGTQLTASTIALADLESIYADEFPGFNGPELELEVVGIGRSGPDIAGEIGQGVTTAAIGTTQLAATTFDTALWWPAGVLVRTSADLDEFDLLPRLEAAGVISAEDSTTFGGRFVGGITDERGTAVQTATGNVRTMAIGLGVFGALALAAGMIIVGQSVVRHLGGTITTRRTLAQLGQSRRAIAAAATIPVSIAAIGGTLAGTAAAIAASTRLPTGIARRAESDTGVWIRPEILIPIGIGSILATAGFCFVVSLRRRPATSDVAAAPAALTRLVRTDPPVPIEIGARLALQRGRGSRMLPTRSAFTGLTLAVLAVTAAMTIVHNVDDLASSPSKWGWNWSSAPWYAGSDTEGALAELALDPRVDGVGSFVSNGVSIDGAPTGGFAIEPVAGELGFVVRDGRLPRGPGEVSLGERTRRRLDVAIGDTVELADIGGRRARTVTVVGTTVYPYEITETVDDGVGMLPATLFDIADPDEAQRALVVRYADGADLTTIEAALGSEYDLVFAPTSLPRAPAPVRNLSVTNDVAIALAIFVSVLGLTATTHAVAVTARRRRLDVAVWRALGLPRRHVREAFLSQAMVFGLVAVAIGIPSGTVVAMVVWRSVTNDLGTIVTPSVPWMLAVSLVPIVLAAAALLSWWPGRTASRQGPADSLRVE